MRKGLISALVAIAMALCVAPGAAFAAGIQAGQADLTVNTSKVAFAGHEWWVVGDATSGVYPQAGHTTLLAANNDFGSSAFRSGNGATAADGYTAYDGKYYANNPAGMTAWKYPYEYAGSTLQQEMESIANDINTNSSKEYALISARNLTIGYGIARQSIDAQKLWALSYRETYTIDENVGKFDNIWWLLTPGDHAHTACTVGKKGNPRLEGWDVDDGGLAVRPALQLNLSSVLFTSSASEGGKAMATVGGGLQKAAAATGTLKFTMKDSSQTLELVATPSQAVQTGAALEFSYKGATTGANQYVSCDLKDADGAVVNYGKLADCSGEDAASGALSIPLDGVEDGAYTLEVFSEEANGDTSTDFCGEPVTMTVTVSAGQGTVSDFNGTVLHEWSSAWTSDGTHHWHECETPGCFITDDSQKDGYEEHGGEATCIEAAFCETCSTEYGATDPDNHAGLEHYEALAPTKSAPGYIEHWHCLDCGRYFTDAACQNEADYGDDILIPALGSGKSSKSGKSDSDDAADADAAASAVPRTGDGAPAAPALLVGAAAMAGIALAARRRASVR